MIEEQGKKWFDRFEAENFYGGPFVQDYTMELPKELENTLDIIREIGNPLIVGGSVRDSFIGAQNKDFDVEVHGTNIDDLAKFLRKNGFIVDEVGKAFGVLKVSNDKIRDLDISVPRTENRLGAGHRSFTVKMDDDMSVSEAAERRDFTFNAIMYDHQRKVLVDPTGGRKDFENKIMRHVSDKFAEDSLRVLRGFQFAARFDLKWDPETAQFAKSLRSEYDTLSIERVQEEWTKFFTKSTHPERGVKALKESGWDDTIPGLRESLSDKITVKNLNNIVKLDKDVKPLIGSSIIAEKMNESDKDKFLKSVLIGNDDVLKAKDILRLKVTNLDTPYKRKRIAFKLASRGFTFKNLSTFAYATHNEELSRIAHSAGLEGVFTSPEPDLIMGRDILTIVDKKPGPWIGELVTNFREMQYNNAFKNKDEALVALSKELDRIK